MHHHRHIHYNHSFLLEHIRALRACIRHCTFYLQPFQQEDHCTQREQNERRIPMKFTAMDDMLIAGKIQEKFSSPWASPLCFLRKKDKSLRLTVDYGH
jgi:hypothetical protein